MDERERKVIAFLLGEDGYIDDDKSIARENLMIIHCDVVHDDSSLYAMLNCAICPYKAECKKYTYRHNGKTPIEVLREQGDKQ